MFYKVCPLLSITGICSLVISQWAYLVTVLFGTSLNMDQR